MRIQDRFSQHNKPVFFAFKHSFFGNKLFDVDVLTPKIIVFWLVEFPPISDSYIIAEIQFINNRDGFVNKWTRFRNIGNQINVVVCRNLGFIGVFWLFYCRGNVYFYWGSFVNLTVVFDGGLLNQ